MSAITQTVTPAPVIDFNHLEVYDKFKTVGSDPVIHIDTSLVSPLQNCARLPQNFGEFHLNFDNDTWDDFTSGDDDDEKDSIWEPVGKETQPHIEQVPEARLTFLDKIKDFWYQKKEEKESSEPVNVKVPVTGERSKTTESTYDKVFTIKDKIKFSKMADMMVYKKDSTISTPPASDSPAYLSSYSTVSTPSTSPESSPILRKKFSNNWSRSVSFQLESDYRPFKPMSILKSKTNQNFHHENSMLKKIDNIDLEAFLVNFENDELLKYHQESYLSGYRQKQIKKYYREQTKHDEDDEPSYFLL